MSDSPERIRADIEATRRELGSDVDALADKVSPSKIVDRQVDRVRGAFGSIRERLMGSEDDADHAPHGARRGSLAENVGDVRDTVIAKAEGSPLAIGLIAFGAGLVLASLFPATRKEQTVAESVKEQAQPLVHEAADAVKEVGAHLKEPAQDAVDAVKDAAQDSMETVKAEAQSAAHEVKDQVQESRENLGE